MATPASALAPFRVRAFRYLWTAELSTSWALEMETIILGWYVLTETGSVLLLVLFGALTYFGMLVSPLFGLIGDRIGYRNMLCLTRGVTAALAAVLLGFAATGALSPAAVLVVATLASMTRSSDLIMRYAVTGVIMPAGVLMGAMGVSRATVDSARVAGALAGAGVVTAFGMVPAYLVIVAFHGLSVALTLRIADERQRSARPSNEFAGEPALTRVWRDLSQAVAYTRTEPALLAAMSVAFLINLCAYPFSMGLLPYVAKNVYDVGQTGLGYLSAGVAFGSLLGSLAVSTTPLATRAARAMILSVVFWYLTLVIFAHAPGMTSALLLLALGGFLQSVCVTPLAVVMLRIADPAYRGRVMGLRMLGIYGLPIGLMISGPLIEGLGFLATTTLYAGVGLVAIVLIGWRWREAVWRRDAPANGGK
jgi:predicted MFS family arabinose efflux permease